MVKLTCQSAWPHLRPCLTCLLCYLWTKFAVTVGIHKSTATFKECVTADLGGTAWAKAHWAIQENMSASGHIKGVTWYFVHRYHELGQILNPMAFCLSTATTPASGPSMPQARWPERTPTVYQRWSVPLPSHTHPSPHTLRHCKHSPTTRQSWNTFHPAIL